VTRGYLALVVHAHLPYVRHPEDEHFLEEHWFFEAMTETYIPLLHVFEGLLRDRIDFRLTLSLSPPLVAMMRDPLLLARYARRLDALVELGHREVERTRGDSAFAPLAWMYRDRLLAARDTFRRWEGDIPRAFRAVEDAGMLELLTCTATHMFLPLADRNWAACHAQIELAAREHARHFGRRPRGLWLAECGWTRGVDELLRESGVRYVFVDAHGLLFGVERDDRDDRAELLLRDDTERGVRVDHDRGAQEVAAREVSAGEFAFAGRVRHAEREHRFGFGRNSHCNRFTAAPWHEQGHCERRLART